MSLVQFIVATNPRVSGIARLSVLLAAFSLPGCIDPITQWRCGDIAHEAIRAVGAGDKQTLESLLIHPSEAEKIMTDLQPQMPGGKIRYVGDSYLFPMSYYVRFYRVHPSGSSSDKTKASLPITIFYTRRNEDHSIGIEGMRRSREKGETW